MTEQARVVYDLGRGEPGDAPQEHPQRVMLRLAAELGFKVLDATPQSIADCWWFWIEYSTTPELPRYIRKAAWLPVGSC